MQQHNFELLKNITLPTVAAVRSRRFDLNSETTAFLEHLETHGYAVVAAVASPAEVERAKDLTWQFLEGHGRMQPNHARRGEPSTWELNDGWLGNGVTGIIDRSGVGQAPFMWYLRLLPAVSKAFGAIWNVDPDELLCSFDGANVFRPWQYKSEWKTKGGWHHLDQNSYNPGKCGRCCIQGLVTLERADEKSGGLVVIPGSHQHFLKVCERNAEKPQSYIKNEMPDSNINLMDYVRVKDGDDILSEGAYLVCAEAGDLIVWDSRTVHCNTPALADFDSPRNKVSSVSSTFKHWDLIRMAAYICMTPSSWSNEEVLKNRWEAYINNVSTTHWPHIYSGENKGPHDMPQNNPATITARQRRLIGAWMEPPEIYEKEYTQEQLEARRLLELAEKAEADKDCYGAIRLYRRAYKLDPSLEFPNE